MSSAIKAPRHPLTLYDLFVWSIAALVLISAGRGLITSAKHFGPAPLAWRLSALGISMSVVMIAAAILGIVLKQWWIPLAGWASSFLLARTLGPLLAANVLTQVDPEASLRDHPAAEESNVQSPAVNWQVSYTDFLVGAMEDALNCEDFLGELDRCPSEYHHTVRNGWVCVLGWAFDVALRQSFPDDAVAAEAALETILRRTVARQDWFDAKLCDAMNPHIYRLMPGAWTNTGESGLSYPIAEWLLAMTMVDNGFELSKYNPGFGFGVFFSIYLPKLIIEIRDTTNKILAAQPNV